jgi:hypothetical protein
MSEKLVLGGLRLLRLLVGVLAAGACVRALFLLPHLLRLHEGFHHFLTFAAGLLWAAASMAAFEGLRWMIHTIHRQSYGRPHPALRRFWSA